MTRAEIPTPALLLDLDRFERNLAKMAAHVNAAGKKIRPHSKTHKCPEIARRQVAAGAVGVCVAKVSEAEVMGEGPAAVRRRASRQYRGSDFASARVCTDDPHGSSHARQPHARRQPCIRFLPRYLHGLP